MAVGLVGNVNELDEDIVWSAWKHAAVRLMNARGGSSEPT